MPRAHNWNRHVTEAVTYGSAASKTAITSNFLSGTLTPRLPLIDAASRGRTVICRSGDYAVFAQLANGGPLLAHRDGSTALNSSSWSRRTGPTSYARSSEILGS